MFWVKVVKGRRVRRRVLASAPGIGCFIGFLDGKIGFLGETQNFEQSRCV